eukprot:CAMPEP_0119356930 /NCGR_PEP_ID=MMETSP1334-20130426/5425_1 /TAXON_ID=127549 /ORGANISM="Calcidiscus leptoporus, Strain RCC1130" /LENGTH=344 /DNA_ID=CAMNT_0007371063 /DNA_START=332 /DNA_END=1366 /DNA_ORIENTATION=-
MQTPNILASSSKFPAAMAIVGAVGDPDVPLTFSTRARDVFSWWATDPLDMRSDVTLHHLLTFTSGLVSADFGACGMRCLNTSNTSHASLVPSESCAWEIFADGPWAAAPGTVWSYHSLHLQLAGAMAAKAAGLSLPDLLHKYLLDRLGMRSSFWSGNQGGSRDPNPHLAATLVSTGDDYDKLLQAVLTYSIAGKEVMDLVEMDAYRTYPHLAPANNSKDLGLEFYGHYSMCTYFECVNQPWSGKCEKAGVHADPGYFGYWPLVNRAKGYYMQLVVARKVTLPASVITKYNVSEAMIGALSAQCVSPLRFNLTDPVEMALGLPDLSPAQNYSLPFPINVLCKLAE